MTRATVPLLFMIRYRRSALLRAFAILFLLWVGADFGAHGFCPADLVPIGSGSPAWRLNLETGTALLPLSPDHCFSHGIFLGAVPVPGPTGLIPAGSAIPGLVVDVPDTDPHPLDKPPQLRS